MSATVLPAVEVEEEDGVVYPESDGQPLAETSLHVKVLILLYSLLEHRYRERSDVLLAMDLFWYWKKGDPSACTAPNLMVIFGAGNQERRSYKLWRENNIVPAIILEVASESTWRQRLFDNRADYERLGVSEYFLFDPEDDYLPEQLMGFRLQQGRYRPITLDEQGFMVSQTLNLKLKPVGRYLRAFDPVTHVMELYGYELVLAEKQRADAERQQKEEERRQKEDALKEVDALRAQLAQLRAEHGLSPQPE